MDRFRVDLQRAFRSLLRTPGFSASALLTVALACTANTAMFSILYSTLLKPLPYTDPDRLVSITASNPSRNVAHVGLSPADFVNLRNSTAFSALAFYTDQTYTLTGLGNPETLVGFQVSNNLFQLLGSQPIVGRVFAPDEGANGNSAFVLLSHRFWKVHFASDSNIVGRAIKLDGQNYTIVGVMPPDFVYPSGNVDLWTTLELPANAADARNARYLRGVGRLRPGVHLEQARAQLQFVAANMAAQYPDTDASWHIDGRTIREAQVGDLRLPLLVMEGGALLLLLVGSLNFGNLLLARAMSRQRQVAMQIALGAGKRTLLRGPAAEGLILCFFGSVAAMLLSIWLLRFLRSGIPIVTTGQVIVGAQGFSVEGWVLALSTVLCFGVGLFAGCLPVLRGLWAESVLDKLAESGRGYPRVIARSPLRAAFVVVEVALSLMLLIGSGLMIKSHFLLLQQPLGFEPDRVLTMHVVLPMNRYSPASIAPFIDAVETKMRTIPGVNSVGSTSVLPMSGMGARRPFRKEGVQITAEQQQADFRLTTPGYFKTMGMQLLTGRDFDSSDRAGKPAVIVVSESLAHLFGDPRNAVGRQLLTADFGDMQPKEIIGVVSDIHDEGLANPPQQTIYRPFFQSFWPVVSFELRASVSPMTVASAATAAIWSVDRGLPVNNISSMQDVIADSLAVTRDVQLVLTIFAALAFLLAILGVYGLMAYDVRQRTYEFGIRLALGAERSSILWLVLSSSLRLVSFGLVLGIGVSLMLTKSLSSLLYGVHPNDPVTFFAVALAISLVSAIATLIPSIRALRLDPALVLKAE